MRFHLNVFCNDMPLSIRCDENTCCWWYNGKQVTPWSEKEMPSGVNMVIGKQYIYVEACRSGDTFVPYELLACHYDGRIYWDIGEVARTVSHQRDFFSSVSTYTVETLKQHPYGGFFADCPLCEGHEYVLAFAFAGYYWLFDATDKRFLKRIFTK